jgi:hypothetical protein
VQPTGDTFAPAGKSFHQDQAPEPLTYSDGFRGACAVDVVKRNPGRIHAGVSWADVPAQASAEALRWGVHANVDQGAMPEPWHIQPVEIDGWSSWMIAGRPAPRPNYPLPNDKPPPPPPTPPSEDPDVIGYNEIKAITTAPPVAAVVAGQADRWLMAALLKATLFDVTGSDEYDQAAALKLDAAVKRAD